MVRLILEVTDPEAKEACGKDQICVGSEAGIDGGIHVMQILWQHHDQ